MDFHPGGPNSNERSYVSLMKLFSRTIHENNVYITDIITICINKLWIVLSEYNIIKF